MAKITGGDGFKRRLNSITGPEAVRRIGEALYVAGDAIKVDAQISITAGSVSGKSHVPSAPGQPPKNDTGVLVNNIEVVQHGPLHVQVSSNAPYAAALEYGTSKMAARPYMQPAVDQNRDAVRVGVAIAVSSVSGGARSKAEASAVSSREARYFGGAKGSPNGK